MRLKMVDDIRVEVGVGMRVKVVVDMGVGLDVMVKMELGGGWRCWDEGEGRCGVGVMLGWEWGCWDEGGGTGVRMAVLG